MFLNAVVVTINIDNSYVYRTSNCERRLMIIGSCQAANITIVENKSGGEVKTEISNPANSRMSITFHQLFLPIFHLVANTENRKGKEINVKNTEKH